MSSHIISSGKLFKVFCRFVPGSKKYSACFFRFALPFHLHALNTEFDNFVTWIEFHDGEPGRPFPAVYSVAAFGSGKNRSSRTSPAASHETAPLRAHASASFISAASRTQEHAQGVL